MAIWDQTPSRLERGASLFSAMGHINRLEMQSQEFSCCLGECTATRLRIQFFIMPMLSRILTIWLSVMAETCRASLGLDGRGARPHTTLSSHLPSPLARS